MKKMEVLSEFIDGDKKYVFLTDSDIWMSDVLIVERTEEGYFQVTTYMQRKMWQKFKEKYGMGHWNHVFLTQEVAELMLDFEAQSEIIDWVKFQAVDLVERGDEKILITWAEDDKTAFFMEWRAIKQIPKGYHFEPVFDDRLSDPYKDKSMREFYVHYWNRRKDIIRRLENREKAKHEMRRLV